MLSFGALAVALSLTALMVLAARSGHRLGRRHRDLPSVGAGEGAIFAMFGLLIAFSFSNAYGRYGDRRMLASTEASTIGTAYLRLDLVAEPQRRALQPLFRRYAESRHKSYFLLANDEAFEAELAIAADLQRRIWPLAIEGTSDTPSRALVLGALNEMFDIVTQRTTVIRAHPPFAIFSVLVLVALACAAMLGYSARAEERLNPVHALGFALVTGASLYLVFELEYPRYGLIRLDRAQDVLAATRKDMGEP